jgi:hypothetical protein
VLSFALIRQGHEPLHATVVVVDGTGVAFLGRSGDGKSTLAASFLHAGHQILTDDMLLIRDIGGIPCGFPGPARVKLFPEVAQRFQPFNASGTLMHPEGLKLILSLGGRQVPDGPIPMHGFFVLEEPPDTEPGVTVAPLSGTESLLALVTGTFNCRLRSPERLARQFLTAEHWIARLPVRRLRYPRTLAMLDHVRHAIISEVRSGGPNVQ